MDINEAVIASLAPDAPSLRNGRAIMQSGQFSNVCRNESATAFFGHCTGSGATPYSVTVDVSAAPVFICSCPSRKRPCKHALGLLLCYAAGQPFAISEIPQPIQEKRKTVPRSGPKEKQSKTGAVAAAKKIAAQLEGLALAHKLVSSIVSEGIGSVNGKTLARLHNQSKQLGNLYLPGVQKAFREILDCFTLTDTEVMYSSVCASLARFHAITEQGRAYLQKRLDDPALPRDAQTELESLLGYAWQLSELRERGLVQYGVRLLQLAFTCRENEPAQQYEDIGIWLDVDSGQLFLRVNYRPYRAVRHIQQEDSCFSVAVLSELCRYPARSMNARVRWEGTPSFSDPAPGDWDKAMTHAAPCYASLIRRVKEQLKDPLCDRNPWALASFATIGHTGEGWALEDGAGHRIPLADADGGGWPASISLLTLPGNSIHPYSAALLRFQYRNDRLTASVISLLGPGGLLRLAY